MAETEGRRVAEALEREAALERKKSATIDALPCSNSKFMTVTSVSIFWFRRDLRLADNAGLYHALKGPNPGRKQGRRHAGL